MFVLRTLMQFAGIGEGDSPGDTEIGDIDDVHADSDAGFRLLSLQGLTAFAMMFGLVGLALTRQSGVGPCIALGVAALTALGCVWIIGKIFGFFATLQSSGTINLYSAIGKEGVVHLSVGEGKVGQVQVEVQGRLGTFDARSEGEKLLPSGTRVYVVRIMGDVLVVQAVPLISAGL